MNNRRTRSFGPIARTYFLFSGVAPGVALGFVSGMDCSEYAFRR